MAAEDVAGRPLLGALQPASLSERHFQPLGIDVTCLGADQALMDAAASVLESRAPAVPTGLRLRLLLLRSPAGMTPGRADGLGAFAAAADGRAYREAGSLLAVLTPSGSCVLADLEGGRASAFVSGAADLDSEAEALFGAPVWRFAAGHGLVACHAATVVGDSGRGILLRAAGGGGKSTLALAAWSAGLGLLAEEVTWLDARSDDAAVLLLRGRPDRIHVAEDVLETLGLAASAGHKTLSAGTVGGKARISLDKAPERLRGSSPAGPVVFLVRGEPAESGAWRPIGPLEAGDRWRATAIPGEASQAASALAAVHVRLLARGAYLLGNDAPARMVERLRAIDAHWEEQG